MSDTALALRGVSRRFGAVQALEEATLLVRPGTVHALLGENGAGKSTLMRIAFGLVQPDGGTIEIDGAVRRLPHAADAIAAGIGMVHQHFSLVPAMTAAENVALGRHGRFDPVGAAERLREVAAGAGLAIDPEAPVHELSVAAQQRLEILKALVRGARILLLDEPTAVLAPAETEELMVWLRRFVAQGNAAVLITHKLREALAVADEVTVLRRGRTVLAEAVRATSAETLARAMLGETAPPDEPRADARVAPLAHDPHPIIEARDVALRSARGPRVLRAMSFAVARGEIVGIAAVEGSGQHELLRALAGRIAPAHGMLRLPARETIAFVPEDRHRDALALDLTLPENLALRGAGARRGLMRWHRLRHRTAALMAAHDVRAGNVRVSARALSGGNQQKFVLARELDGDPALVVAENPTRGLDIHASREIRERLREASARGAAVVLYSTDLDEVLALCSRVLVLHAGLVTELPPDRDRVGAAMLGAL